MEKAYYTLGPRIFPIYDDPFDAYYHLFRQNRVLLYGFAPLEPVRLLLYHGKQELADNDFYFTDTFIGSQPMVTGPDGNLLIKNQIPNANLWIAIGETSGTIIESFYADTGSLKERLPKRWMCSAQ